MKYLFVIILALFVQNTQAAVSTTGGGSRLITSSPSLSDYPFTILAYVSINNTTSTRTVFQMRIDNSNRQMLNILPTTNYARISVAQTSNSTVYADTSGSLSVDAWYPVAFVAASDTSRIVYLWSAIGGTRESASESSNRDFLSYTSWRIAESDTGATTRVQDVAVLDVALNTTQLDEWAAGKTALACSFESDVIAYQPLVGGVNESGYRGPTFSEEGSVSWVTGPSLTGPIQPNKPLPNLSGNLQTLSGNLQ